MVIIKKDLEKIILVYRIFTLHYGFKIDTLLEFRALIRAINIQHIRDWCGLVIEDDLVLIDDEILDLCKKSIIDNPEFIGDPDEESDEEWGEWGHTSEADRKTFHKVSDTNWWENIDNLTILNTNWEDYLEGYELDYFRGETKMNRFVFWFDYDFKNYHNEIKNRRLQEFRDLKLDLLF